MERGAEIDRKLYTEDLDSLTGGFFFPLLRIVHIKEHRFFLCQLSGFAILDNGRHGDSPEKRDGKAGGGERLPGDFFLSVCARSRSSARLRR